MTVPGVAGVILVGGRSSRMGGGDKTLLPLGDRPMLARVIERLAPQVPHLAVNANGDPERFTEFGLPAIADATADFRGPLAGILAGLEWAVGLSDTTHLASAAGDTPFLPSGLVARLAAVAGATDAIVVARSRGRLHPTFALWPITLRHELIRFLASGKKARVTDFVTEHLWSAVDFGMEPLPGRYLDPFFNINTPDDLHEAERVAEFLP